MHIGQITHKMGAETFNLNIDRTNYSDGNMAVVLTDQSDKCQFAVLSVNIPEFDYMLEDGKEFFAKTWSENQQIANQLRNSEFFKDTGLRVDINFVTAEV